MNKQDQKAIMGTFVVVVVFAALMMWLNKSDPPNANEEALCISESVDSTTPPDKLEFIQKMCHDNWHDWDEKWEAERKKLYNK